MGVFDLFGRDNNVKTERNERFAFNGEQNKDQSVNKSPVSIFKPTSFKDVENIIDVLKSGKSAIVHMTQLKTETAIRVIDLLSGAVYALDGGVYEMEKNIFMFSPTGVEMN